jgi:Family of unknown function (DUF6290)
MTITVRLTKELEAALKARLSNDGIALSEFVRQAIGERLEREGATLPSAYDLWQQHFKGWSSGETDRSERAEEILRAKFDAKRRR